MSLPLGIEQILQPCKPGELGLLAYRILEVSGDLRARQRETLAGRDPRLLERVRWIDSPPGEGWRGVVLANEVADALPVERFRVAVDGLDQLGAVEAGEGFAELVAHLLQGPG